MCNFKAIIQKETLKPFEPKKNNWVSRKQALDALDISSQRLTMALSGKRRLKGEHRKHLLKGYDIKKHMVNIGYYFEYRERLESFYENIKQCYYEFSEIYTDWELSVIISDDCNVDHTSASLFRFFSTQLFDEITCSHISFKVRERAIVVARWFDDNYHLVQGNQDEV